MSTATFDTSVQSVQVALSRGDFATARRLCEGLLARDARNLPARYCLGLAHALSGEPDSAIAQWRQVLEQQPRDFPTLVNLGVALSRQGRHTDAIPLLRSALAIDASPAQVHFNLGNSLLAVGDLDAALDSLIAATARDPGFAAAHNSLGVAYRRASRQAEACSEFARAIAADSACVEAHGNLGIALHAAGDSERAVTSLKRALELEPGYVEAALTLAQALERLERTDEAITTLMRAASSDTTTPELHHALGVALHRAGRTEDALLSYERALALRPAAMELWRERAHALESLQRLDDALTSYRRATELAPEDPDTLAGAISCGLRCCDWQLVAENLQSLRRTASGLRALHPFVALSVCEDPAEQLQVASAHAERGAGPDAADGRNRAAAAGTDRIRLAYVSSDLRDHAIAHLLIGVLENHDRQRFEVHAVSLRPQASETGIEARLRQAVHAFHDVSACNDSQAVSRLRALDLDLAVDLNGYTTGARAALFAARIAPVQVGYLGYAGTLGASYMDYLVADETVIPQGEERWYTERVIRLPQCYLPNDNRRQIGPVPARAQVGLPEDGFVFCAFTQPYKISRLMFDTWMRLLRAVPGSVLWLKQMGDAARRSLLQAAAQRDIPAERLVFASHVSGMLEHLGRLALTDICLDTFPYNAHSSACDALWAGVPLLTCAGRSFAARVAASALTSAGLPELITRDLSEYEQRALELAADPQQLTALRTRVGAARVESALFDTVRYTRHLESAYTVMRQR